MQTFNQIQPLRQVLNQARLAQQRIAFIPTMGNLHAGHLALVAAAQAAVEKVVVSIFVNPLQFDRAADLEGYPRTLAQDLASLATQGVDYVFTPDNEILYPDGLAQHTFVEVPELTNRLEGASRPGHFRGVSTVVNKLFNIVKPDMAVFGEKDFQQLLIIQQMVRDLNLDIQIVSLPTVRDQDGLALSSRNSRLTMEQRHIAPQLSQVMFALAEKLADGRRDISTLIKWAENQLKAQGWLPDGLAICDAFTLTPLKAQSKQAVILMAAWLGEVRLIDNQRVKLPISKFN